MAATCVDAGVRQALGEALYPLVCASEAGEARAGKVTGMLLELGSEACSEIITGGAAAVDEKVAEALAVLAQADEAAAAAAKKASKAEAAAEVMSPTGPADFPSSNQTTPDEEADVTMEAMACEESVAATVAGAPLGKSARSRTAGAGAAKALAGTVRKLEADLETVADAKRKGKGAGGKAKKATSAKELAARLEEPKVALVARAVATLGHKRVQDLIAETEEVESNGGMMIADGTRRRRKGGVFWALVKEATSHEQYGEIFAAEKAKQRERCARRQRQRYLKRKEALSRQSSLEDEAAKVAPSAEELAKAAQRTSPNKRSFAQIIRSD